MIYGQGKRSYPGGDAPTTSEQLVARSRVSADQWAMHLDPVRLPYVTTWEHWLQSLAGSARYRVLTGGQSLAIWRSLVDAEPRLADELIDPLAIAEWARSAWELIRGYGIDASELRTASHSSPDLRLLVQWGRQYDSDLRARGWLDSIGVRLHLLEHGPQHAPACVRSLDPGPWLPLERRVRQRLSDSGFEFVEQALPLHEAEFRTYAAAHREAEIDAAGAWLLRAWQAAPEQRFALILPAGFSSELSIHRLIGDACPLGFPGGKPLRRLPLIAAALTVLRLFSPAGSMLDFSAWLRSPYFSADKAGSVSQRGMLEMQLRQELLGQVPFTEAYRQGGLAQWVRHRATDVGACLDTVMATPDSGKARTVSQWVQTWRDWLQAVGWTGTVRADVLEANAALDKLLGEFARLGPVLPAMLSSAMALQWLEEIVARSSMPGVLPPAGIHVLPDMDAIGPGYTAIWVMGLTDEDWPAMPALNPLVPLELQRKYGVPGAAAGEVRREAQARLQRMTTAAPQVMVSWHQQAMDGERTRSRWLAENLPSVAAEEINAAAIPATGVGETQELPDEAVALIGTELKGGTGLLNLQSRCPLAAFIRYRLHAKPLEEWPRGVSARWRGMLLHDCAHRIFSAGMSGSQIAAWRAEELAEVIRDAVDSAINTMFKRARYTLPALAWYESERAVAILNLLVQQEAARAAFEVVEAEEKMICRIAGRDLTVKIDRLDRLHNGKFAIIDYKTGLAGKKPHWFDDQPTDWQIPMYAVSRPEQLDAALLCQLRADGVAYVGYWGSPDEFPGSSIGPDNAPAFDAEIGRWRDALEALMSNFVAGDFRFMVAERDDLEGQCAPLSGIWRWLGPAAERNPSQ